MASMALSAEANRGRRLPDSGYRELVGCRRMRKNGKGDALFLAHRLRPAGVAAVPPRHVRPGGQAPIQQAGLVHVPRTPSAGRNLGKKSRSSTFQELHGTTSA